MTARDHRPALNALRGFAALAIVVYHFRYYSPFPWSETFPALRLGYVGVDFFFVLSGLVIAHVYLEGFLQGRESMGRFLFLRVSRLFPVHAAIMTALLLCAVAGGSAIGRQQATDWVTLTLLTRQWTLPESYVWNHPAWSVSAEMFAYCFVFPIVVALARRCDRLRLGVSLLVLGAALLVILKAMYGTLNVNPSGGPLVRVTGGFLAGAGIYCLLSARERGASWDRVLIAGAALIPAAVLLGSDLAVVAALCVVTVGAYMSTGAAAKALSYRPLYALGEISFSLYLCHSPIFRLAKAAADLGGIHRGPLFCVATTGVCLIAATLLYKTIELPARAALRKWWERSVPIDRSRLSTS